MLAAASEPKVRRFLNRVHKFDSNPRFGFFLIRLISYVPGDRGDSTAMPAHT